MRNGRIAAGIVAVVVSGAVALVGLRGAVPHTPTAQAQSGTTYEVIVGGSAPADIETNAFFPRAITIRQGDTVSWQFRGFHTVTFNADQPSLAVLVPGPDPGDLTIGPALMPFPPGPNPPSGPYDGASQVSSGAPQGPDDPPFTLTFTQPGVFGYVCTIHPGQVGTVTVLPASSTPPEAPEQAAVRGAAEFASLISAIQGVVAARTASPSADGRIVTVASGVGYPSGASALAFVPSEVSVPQGGSVVWTLADTAEIHTVTFPNGTPEPEFVTVIPPAGPMMPPQLIVRANVAGPVGGAIFSGSGYMNSGIMTPGSSYTLTFDSPPGAYEYLCVVHPEMRATVRVTAP